jgi:hypothetical protein
MATKVIACFTKNDLPNLNLSPVVTIRDLDSDKIVVNNAPMIEVGDGFYKYEFISWDNRKNYVWKADGGKDLNSFERYNYGINDFVP